MKWSAEHLRAIMVAALLGAVMVWLIAGRHAHLQGPAVTGSVIAHDVRESGKRTRSGALRQGKIRTNRYPIVGYVIPATSPQRSGQEAEYAYILPADLPLGTPVPLRLAPEDPSHALVDSVQGIWGLPLLVLWLGSLALWSIANFIHVPCPPVPRARRSGPLWTNRQLLITGAVLLVLVAACLLLSPLLALGLPVLGLCAWGLVETVRQLCSGVIRLFRGPVPGRDRPGAPGLLVDLLERSARFVVIGGLFAVSLTVSLAGMDASFPRHAASWNWLNSMRSLAWQPYDFSAALSRAARDGDLDAARWLAPRAAQAHLGGAAAIALTAGHDDLVRLLLAHGADPNVQVPGAEPMLLYAIQNHRDPALIEALLKAGADPNCPLPDGRTITDALQTLDRIDRTLELLPLLARHGAHLDHRDANGRTFLMRASAAEDAWQLRIVPLLLALGADPNVAAADGRTALDLAQASGASATVQLLLAKGARSGRRRRPRSLGRPAAAGTAAVHRGAGVAPCDPQSGPERIRRGATTRCAATHRGAG